MNALQTGLQITVIGMGLVFAAILLLWWMMILLAKFTADKDLASDSPKPFDQTPTVLTLIREGKPDSVPETETLAQAAAIGVAMAMAEQQLSSAHPLKDPPTVIISAWQLGMRTRQMTQKGYNRPPRSYV